MPGLMNPADQAPPQEAPQGEEQENPETVADEEGEEASPEEQAAYEEFVKTGYGLMYEGGEVRPQILKMLDEDPSDLMAVLENAEELKQFSPVVALAATGAIITLETCRKTGEKDGTVIFHGGKAILEDVAEIAQKAGIRDYSADEVGNAFRMGADLFREVASKEGLIDLDEAKGEWDEIVAADKEGKLGEVIPQLADAQVEGQDQPQPQAGGMMPDGQL